MGLSLNRGLWIFSLVLKSISSLILLTSCMEPVDVTRDLRMVWDPAGDSILLVQQQYTTTTPDSPYFADENATNARVNLFVFDGESGLAPETTALTDFGARRLVDSYREGIWSDEDQRAYELSDQGGLAEYAPVYWFPQAAPGGRAVFSIDNGGGALVRDLGAARSQWYHRDLAAVATALESAYGLPSDYASLFAGLLNYRGAVPSPDGTLLALVFDMPWDWEQSGLERPEGWPSSEETSGGGWISVFDDYFTAVQLWDMDSARALGAFVPLPDSKYMVSNLTPYFPLDSDSQNFSFLVWEAEGSAFLVYYYLDTEAAGLVEASVEQPQRRVVRVGLGPLPATAEASLEFGRVLLESADELPRRPLPTSSGPVDSRGRALVMSVQGNRTRLSLEALPEAPGLSPALPAWEGFDLNNRVSLEDWLAPHYSQEDSLGGESFLRSEASFYVNLY